MRGCAFFLLLMPVLALAQVYKWVDANGVTHYGESPPAASKSREVKLRDANPRADNAPQPAAAGAYKDRELEFRKRQAERERAEARVAEDKGARERECRTAANELNNLRSSGRIYDLNEKGERVWLSDAQRDSAIAKHEAEYNRRCR
jgi:hypothetical protein